MFDLQKIVRKNIQNLKPYSSARDEFSGKEGVFLDANENPFGVLNRYPDPYQEALKKELGRHKSVNVSKIFIGNGSDEVVDLAFRAFCTPGLDKALTFTPTYGMYDVSAAINDVELIKIPLDTGFQMNLDLLEGYLQDEHLKLIFICSPNNPTGNNLLNIEQVVQKFKGIVVIDEAYIDFSDQPSFITKMDQYPNVIISQTFSKAWGLAAARVGVAYAKEDIIAIFNKIKPPYNVSALNQNAALAALSQSDQFECQKRLILEQKSWLIAELSTLEVVQKIYPSDANFILVEVKDADAVYGQLAAQKVIIRNRNSVVRHCVRITVGTPEENQILIQTLKQISQ